MMIGGWLVHDTHVYWNSKELTGLLGMIWQMNDADYRDSTTHQFFHGEYRNQGNAYRLSPILKTAQVKMFHICP